MDKNDKITSIVLTKTDVEDLGIGMYVSKLDRPWLESTFLFQGFEIKSIRDLKEVQNQCDYVYIDTEHQEKVHAVPNTKIDKPASPEAPPPPKKKAAPKKLSTFQEWLEKREAPEPKASFEEEIGSAANVFKESSSLVKSYMESIALGRPINIELAKQVVSQCVQSIINAPDALMWLTQLKKKDEYTSQHSMNVCIFSIALGRQINFPVAELEKLGLCGLMHDMGKLKIPLEVLNKPGRFTPEERAVMETHPELGMRLLLSDESLPGCVIDAIYGHHERLDGKGYPRGLPESSIHPYTRIVTIADMYDAITSDRIYKNGRTHLEAINIMTTVSGTHLDSGLVIKFIECLGIYPPGNIVEMSNGEIAIVIEVNRKKKLKPKITMLLDENKKKINPRFVDLAKIDLDPTGNPYAIRRMVRPEDYNLNVNYLYNMGLLQHSLKQA